MPTSSDVPQTGPGPESHWPHDLNPDDLIAAGWSPLPFHTFVLKIHGRCDLACDYCYMYRAADQGWRTQPRVMSRAVVEWSAGRIAEHVRTHRLSRIGVVLHGGEPLLAGPGLVGFALEAIRTAVGPATEVRAFVQTNGLHLTDEWLATLARLGVRVSVSLDGDRAAHDRHRRRADGRGSHAAVTEAVRRLAHGPYRDLFAGLLCTIDLRNDPVATYEELVRHDPPRIDFLLPHGHWSSPPPGRTPQAPHTPYADWLIAVFERWYGAPVRETGVRLLEEIIALLLGERSRLESLGLEPVRYLVIETDGSIGADDTLRSVRPGAAATGLHVARDPLDRALRHPSIVARQLGAAALAKRCTRCAVRRVCGGGHYPHRYRAGTGFANPSVYCPDLFALITHIRARLAADVSALRARTSDISRSAQF